MAEVIPFQDVLRARRRAREQRTVDACVGIIRASLDVTLEELDEAGEHDRPVRARQVRQLAELLEYVVAAR